MSETMESSSNVTLRMIIPGREIGVIIGKGGETIHQIRAEAEAKIFISDGSVPERVITVTGTGDAVCMAYNLMCCRLEAGEEGKNNRKDTLNLKLVVAAAQCGSIIGKQGSKIKEIRETCGANVNVGSDLLPASNERTVAVSGTREKCVEVIYQIVNILASKPFSGSVLQYKPGNGITPFAAGAAMGGGDVRRGGGGMGGMGGGGMGGMGGGALAALASIATSQIRGNDNYRRGDRERDRERDTTHQMTVPNEHIGSIIGKGGSKIAEIRQMSGANIQISKGTDKDQKSDAERQINITGSAEAVTLAKNLINMTLELHQLGRTDEDDDYEESERGRGQDRDRRGGSSGAYRGDYGGYGGGAAMGGGYGGGGAGLGPGASREVMNALNTLAHFNQMTNGSLFGANGPYNQMGGMGRGGRQQNGGRGRDDRGGANNGAVRNKFSPY